jgi:hypothetical protein
MSSPGKGFCDAPKVVHPSSDNGIQPWKGNNFRVSTETRNYRRN